MVRISADWPELTHSARLSPRRPDVVMSPGMRI
jgi:hypothetical protein